MLNRTSRVEQAGIRKKLDRATTNKNYIIALTLIIKNIENVKRLTKNVMNKEQNRIINKDKVKAKAFPAYKYRSCLKGHEKSQKIPKKGVLDGDPKKGGFPE